jgi:hypothetical protein
MKRLLFLLLLTAAPAYAQYTSALLEIDRKDGVYAVGDSIKVWVSVTSECTPVQEFTMQEDMLHDILKQEMRLGAGRHLVYAGVCSKPVNYVFTFGEPGADGDYKKASRDLFRGTNEIGEDGKWKKTYISTINDLINSYAFV